MHLNPLKPSGAKWSHLESVQGHTGRTHHFLIFDIRAKIKNGGLDQYGPERFGRLILLYSQKNAGLKGLTSTTRRAVRLEMPAGKPTID